MHSLIHLRSFSEKDLIYLSKEQAKMEPKFNNVI